MSRLLSQARAPRWPPPCSAPAHTIRGAFDEGSLDAPGAREAARSVLGEAEFGAAYERGRAFGRDEAIAAASGAVGGLAGQVLRR